MSTFNKILQIKCKEGHPQQNINEYMKSGSSLKPICFDCKDLQSGGQFYKSKEINQKLEEILNTIKIIPAVKSKLLENIKKFQVQINRKLDTLQNKLEGDFNKILYNEDVKAMKAYYEIEQPILEASKHIKFATTFLKFENLIERSDFTNRICNQIHFVESYSKNISELSEIITNFQFKEQTQEIVNSINSPHITLPPPKPIQRESQSVQICQQIQKAEYSNFSTANKMFCLTIKPLKSFALTTLWISMLANQTKQPKLRIFIYQNTENDPIYDHEFQIDEQTPIINEKYKVQLEKQCELLEANNYCIVIDHPTDFNCLSADFVIGVSITTNKYFQIIKEAFINGNGKQIIDQIENGLICDVDILVN